MLSVLTTIALFVGSVIPAGVREAPQVRMLSEREALQGRFPIVVNVLVDDEARQFLDARTLQTAIELRLRTIGIDVRETQPHGEPPYSVLALSIDAMKTADGTQLVYVHRLALKRIGMVLLAADANPSIQPFTMAEVWKRGAFGIVGIYRTSQLRQDIDDMTSAFLNDFLAANPKK